MPRLEVSNSDWSMNGREHFDFSSPSLTIRSKPKIFDDCENIGLHLLDSYAENVQCICNGWFEGNEYQWNIFSMKIKNETNNLISWAFKWNWPQKLFGIKTLLKWLSMSAYFQQSRTFFGWKNIVCTVSPTEHIKSYLQTQPPGFRILFSLTLVRFPEIFQWKIFECEGGFVWRYASTCKSSLKLRVWWSRGF